ncbi:hypothetical protein CS0771_45260 [Catellatospora sp. IY07-71]|nr:hypothetical protein CS0771_45260 [Catellatospora sp. IY07-71]
MMCRAAAMPRPGTPLEWSVGAGPEVTGPIDALLLLLTGRKVALSRLAGPGVRDVA